MSEIKEYRPTVREVVVAHKCDVCSAIEHNDDMYERLWFRFDQHHEAWGNDSVDSYERYDVCSVDCFMKKLGEIVPDLQEYADRGGEVANMPVAFAAQLLALSPAATEDGEGEV